MRIRVNNRMTLPPTPDGLEIRQSPIHGLGVFATKDFPSDYCFGEFVGTLFTLKDFKERYGANYDYTYRAVRTHQVISAKENRNWITYLNDGILGQSENRVNCVLKKWCCYSLKQIKAGDELLLSYFRGYKRRISTRSKQNGV